MFRVVVIPSQSLDQPDQIEQLLYGVILIRTKLLSLLSRLLIHLSIVLQALYLLCFGIHARLQMSLCLVVVSL